MRDRKQRPEDGVSMYIRHLTPGTMQRLRIAKARLNAETWTEFEGKALEAVEKNLGR